jgi:hypothetical protein
VDVPYTCTDSGNIKAPVIHTPTQLQQVLADGAAIKLGHITAYHAKKGAIASAATLQALQAIDLTFT